MGPVMLPSPPESERNGEGTGLACHPMSCLDREVVDMQENKDCSKYCLCPKYGWVPNCNDMLNVPLSLLEAHLTSSPPCPALPCPCSVVKASLPPTHRLGLC